MALVLIVDDEVDLAGLLDFNLREAGHQTLVAHTGAQALELARTQHPELVLLDVMLPDLSGAEVCRQLKATPELERVPVVMLTAKADEPDRVQGFESGADDYVTKPFSVRELVLRLRAILKRSSAPATRERLEVGALAIDLSEHRAYVAGGEVALTMLEFRLLQHLLDRPGKVVSRDELLREVWGFTSTMETRTVDTHMMRLREKLGPAREQIETVRGIGYRLANVTRA